uniref:Sulfotransferase domain-containing protein n=1 Tax=Chaetoceros debilis TaxID=122233 RepID=A0A6S8Y6S9_9STRA
MAMMSAQGKMTRRPSSRTRSSIGNLNPVRLVKVTLYLLPVVLLAQTLVVYGKNYTGRGLRTDDVNAVESDSRTYPVLPYPVLPKRLEFVHITKTGGSAIEKAGAMNGVIWGACHYMELEEVGCTKPDLPYISPKYQSYALTSPWHTPPKLLQQYVSADQYPYDDADLFVVVRNPYDRILSEYYCPWTGFHAKSRKDGDPHEPGHLNWWVEATITKLSAQVDEFQKVDPSDRPKVQQEYVNEDPRLLAQKHYVNQAEYVFDGENRVVKNVVHYEHLSEEFNDLMKKYGMDITIPPKHESGVYTSDHGDNRLTFMDLNEASVKIINDYAKADFERLGYKMVDKFEEGVEYNTEATFTS